MLEQIQLEQLQEIIVLDFLSFENRIDEKFELSEDFEVFNMEDFDMETDQRTVNWKNFAEKHQLLESLELDFHTIVDLHILLEKLPKLRSLKIEQVVVFPCTFEATADLIVKCYDRLEHFKIGFCIDNRASREMFGKYLKESYPTIQYTRDKYGFYIFSK
jgi:hypothetical protein